MLLKVHKTSMPFEMEWKPYFELLTTFINFRKKMLFHYKLFLCDECIHNFLMDCYIKGHACIKTSPNWYKTFYFQIIPWSCHSKLHNNHIHDSIFIKFKNHMTWDTTYFTKLQCKQIWNGYWMPTSWTSRV